MLDFYKTRAGRTFFERDVVEIAAALGEIAGAIERIAVKVEGEGVTINYTPPEQKRDMAPWEKVGLAGALISQAKAGLKGAPSTVIWRLDQAMQLLEESVVKASEYENEQEKEQTE